MLLPQNLRDPEAFKAWYDALPQQPQCTTPTRTPTGRSDSPTLLRALDKINVLNEKIKAAIDEDNKMEELEDKIEELEDKNEELQRKLKEIKDEGMPRWIRGLWDKTTPTSVACSFE